MDKTTVYKALGMILFISLLFTDPSLAEMYKWKDDSGKLHFTDSPSKIPKKYRDKTKTIKTSRKSKASTNKPPIFKIPTQGFGKPIGKKATGKTGTGTCAKGIEESKRWQFLQITQMGFGCGEKTIPRPVGDWDCKEIKAKSASCRNKKIYVRCSVQVQCVRETPEYNRAKYKKIMELVIEEGREEREKERKELGEEREEAWKKIEKKFAKELEGKKCDNYYANLSLCKPFSCKFIHPWSGQLMEKKIIGLKGDKCITTEQMPNGGKSSCALTEDMRKAHSKFIEKMPKGKSFSIRGSVSVKGSVFGKGSVSVRGSKATYKIDGKEVKNPFQEAYDNGQCEVSGYENM